MSNEKLSDEEKKLLFGKFRQEYYRSIGGHRTVLATLFQGCVFYLSCNRLGVRSVPVKLLFGVVGSLSAFTLFGIVHAKKDYSYYTKQEEMALVDRFGQPVKRYINVI